MNDTPMNDTLMNAAPQPTARAQVVGAAIVDDLARPTALLAARRTAPPALAGGWDQVPNPEA